MVIDRETFEELYKSLSDPIMSFRIDNISKEGLTKEQVDKRLFELEEDIFSNIKEVLKLEKASEETPVPELSTIKDKLCLTSATPTVPGYYFIERPDVDGVYIDEVIIRPGHSYLAIQEVKWSGFRDFTAVQYLTEARWAGPIELPISKVEESTDEVTDCE